MRQVWIRIGAAAALLISQVALGQDWDFSRAFAAGGSMNGVATTNAERTLQTNPNDLNTRARLLGRYSALAKTGDVEARRARLNHIVWLIEHVPDTALLHEQDVMLIPGDFAPPLQAEHDHLSNAWHEQVRQHPENVAILANAGMSLANADFHTVLDIFPRLRELDPANPQWPLSLASAYALAIHEESGDRPASMNASKTFTALQKSNDEQVTGLTGQMLSLAALGGSPVYQVMGQFLIGRAKTLNPGNPRWQRDVTVSLPKQPTASDLAFQVNRITSDYGAEDLRRGPALPAFPANPARVHVAADVQAGKALAKPAPVWPRGLSLPGPVAAVFEAIIAPNGTVSQFRPLSGQYYLIKPASDVVAHWTYQPTVVNGQPVEVETQIKVDFPNPPAGVPGGLVGGVLGGVQTAAPPPPPPPPPAPPRAGEKAGSAQVRIGGNVIAATKISGAIPVYPPLAKQARIQGTVVLNATIGKDGHITNLSVLSGHALLAPAARDAVKTWVYKPYLVNGEPVEVITQIQVNFTLPSAAPVEASPEN